jgi:hypothetical protein
MLRSRQPDERSSASTFDGFALRRTCSRIADFLEAIECGVLANAIRSEDLTIRDQIDAWRQYLDCGHGHA